MKTWIAGVTGCIGVFAAAAAMAADLPIRRAPPMVPIAVPTWTGFYVGGFAGYIDLDPGRTIGTPLFGSPIYTGGPDFNIANAEAATGRIRSNSGFLGGGQIGYNQQIGSFLVGIETDIGAMAGGQGGSRQINVVAPAFPSNPVVGSMSTRQDFDYFGTLRGRIGFTFGDLLVYGTGGLAYGQKSTDTSLSLQVQTGGGSFVTLPYGVDSHRSSLRTGYTVGGGAEYRLSENWSVKGEALYYDLGRSSTATEFASYTSFTTPPDLFTTTGYRTRTDDRGIIARGGVNYRFSTF